MPNESAPEWPDLMPVLSVRSGGDGVRIVLAEMPQVSWTVQCVLKDGRPRVIRCTAESTSTATPFDLDEHAGRPPYTTLAAIWARARGTDAETTTAEAMRRQTFEMDGQDPDDHDDWDQNPLLNPAPRFESLGKKPDKRRQRKDPEGYTTAMHEWTRPVAEVVRWATAQGRPIGQEVSKHLSPGETPFSSTYAERLIAWAQESGHDLPRRPRKRDPKPPATRRKGPTQPGRSDK